MQEKGGVGRWAERDWCGAQGEARPCGKGAGQRSEGLGRGGKRAAGRGGKKGSWADGVLGPGWVLAGFPFLILFYSISKANTEILIEFKFQFEFKPSTQTKEQCSSMNATTKFNL